MRTVDIIVEELKRQYKEGEVYIRLGDDGVPTDKPNHFLVDGNVDLVALAEAIDSATVRRVNEARFGPPSSWAGDNPKGCHRADQCAPEDAANHDNGINDAVKAIRGYERPPPSPQPSAWRSSPAWFSPPSPRSA